MTDYKIDSMVTITGAEYEALKAQINSLLRQHADFRTEIHELRAALADAQKRFDTLKAAYDAERRKPVLLHGSAAPVQKETNELDETACLYAALNADPQTLRLHLGEMTAQEMRTLKAGFQWVLNRAALAQGGDK